MNCIILGDKYQTGMKSKGCCGLLKINNKTNNIINQYSIISKSFVGSHIVYIYGFDEKKFLDFYSNSSMKIELRYNPYHINYSYAFSLSLAKDVFNDDTLIIGGYQNINKSVIKQIKKNNKTSCVVVGNETTSSDQVGCIINKDNNIEHFSVDLGNCVKDIYYLNKIASKQLSEILANKKYYNYFIFELLNKLIDQGQTIKSISI